MKMLKKRKILKKMMILHRLIETILSPRRKGSNLRSDIAPPAEKGWSTAAFIAVPAAKS